MKVSFVGQPFEEYGWFADWLEQALTDESVETLEIAVAWVKRSGLSRLQEAIERFRERGGITTLIAGIDEGGGTKQGLELALDTFDDVYIFHDRSSRTYHPKIYLLHDANSARLAVGSNNMTAGGLYSNYEATLVVDLDLRLDDDQRLYQEVLSYLELLRADRVCVPLTSELLDTLTDDSQYRIGDEDRPSRQRHQEQDNNDGVIPPDVTSNVFGTSSSPKKCMAPAVGRPRTGRGRRTRAETPTATYSGASSGAPLRWWKRMSASDAQHPVNPKSNPIGSLKLTQAGHGIDQTTFFRDTMFHDANWLSEQRAKGLFEEAIVPVDVVVE